MKVFITRPIPDQGIIMLRAAGHEVLTREKDSVIPREELIAGVRGVDAIISILTDRIDGEVMDAAGSQLKIIANYAIGTDNIDLDAAKKRNVLVSNAPGPEIVESDAEFTFALMLALARRIPEADTFARRGEYHGWGPQLLLGSDLYDKTLGIVGLGRIGTAVAKRAVRGFRMKALYHNPEPRPEFEQEFGARFVDLQTLLRESDFITLHVPLLPSTRHMISDAEFGIMKPSVYLVNTARGPVVDEKALLTALQHGKIAGAALDVFECEPSLDCDPFDHVELKQFKNVILTPHVASATVETRQAISRVTAQNVIEALAGHVPPNLIQQ